MIQPSSQQMGTHSRDGALSLGLSYAFAPADPRQDCRYQTGSSPRLVVPLQSTSRGFGLGTFSHSHRTRRPSLPRVRRRLIVPLPVAVSRLQIRCGGWARITQPAFTRISLDTKLGHHVRQDIADVPKSHRAFSVAGCCRKQPNPGAKPKSWKRQPPEETAK